MAKKRFMGIDPAHKGFCSPMTKSTCTSRRKALAKRLKPGGDLYKGKKQDGGEVTNRDLRVASDSLTAANIDNPWIQRYLQGNTLNIPDPYNPGSGKTSTHGLSYHPLSDSTAMIFPEIIQQGDSLIHLNNDAAREYAIKNKTGITTDLELAKFYSRNGLIDHTQYAHGGEVMAKNKRVPKFQDGGFLIDTFFSDPETTAKTLEGIGQGSNFLASLPYVGSLFKGAAAEVNTTLNPIIQDLNNQGLNSQQNVIGGQQIAGQEQYAPTFCRGGKVRKMPFGGTVDTRLVELEEGEPFRTPDGTMGAVKKDEEFSHANGGATMPLEVGTQILGKQKDPETKKTFKDMGTKLASQKQKYTDILDKSRSLYTENSVKAMNAKIDNRFTELFQRQESLKPNTVQGDIPIAQDGLEVEPWMAQPFDVPQTGYLEPWMTNAFTPPVTTASSGATGINMTAPPGVLEQWYQGQGGASGLLNTGAQLAPVAYNLIQGSRPSEQFRARDFYNPQYDQAINLMQGRRYDPGTELEQNRAASAIGRYNLQNRGASAGQQFAGFQSLAAQRMRADAQARRYASNINLGYQGQEAALRANLGGQRAQTNLNVANINQQAEAARRGMLGAGFTGVSDFAQRQQLTANRERTQQQQLEILRTQYPEFYEKWFGSLSFT